MRVCLIGYMGSGKSAVGLTLAGKLGLPFMDLDSEIEKASGMSIAAIFEELGEPAFRELEEAALRRAYDAGEDAVIACGGGTILGGENRDRMKAGSTVVYLRGPLDLLFERSKASGLRPLVEADPSLERFRGIFAGREKIYEEVADRVVDVEGMTVEEIADTIEKGLDA